VVTENLQKKIDFFGVTAESVGQALPSGAGRIWGNTGRDGVVRLGHAASLTMTGS